MRVLASLPLSCVWVCNVQERKRREAELAKVRKQRLADLNLARPMCSVCNKCEGFQPMLFRPMVCELCGHDRKNHTKQRVVFPE